MTNSPTPGARLGAYEIVAAISAVLGTVGYMSLEQAGGQPADRRTGAVDR